MIDFPDNPVTGQNFVLGSMCWVWDGVKWTTNPSLAAAGGYVPLAGGSMSGPLHLSGAPGTPDQAATKAYVDAALSAAATTLGDDLKTLRSEAGFA